MKTEFGAGRTARSIALTTLTLLLGLLFLSPLYLVFASSLKSVSDIFLNPLGLPSEYQWTNFSSVWAQIDYPRAFSNTLFFVVFGVLGLVVISSMAAYRLSRHKTRANRIIYTVLVSSILIPFQIVMIPLIKMLSTVGLYDTRMGVLLTYYGFGLPFTVFLFSGFLKSVPVEIEEAAYIDGCSTAQVFVLVVLPLMKPIIATSMVLNTLWIYNDFLLPFVLISGNALRTLPLVMFSFFNAYVRPWDLAMASLTMVLAPAIILYLLLQKQVAGGIIAGAVKG